MSDSCCVWNSSLHFMKFFTCFLSGNRGLLPVLKTRSQSEPSESGNLIVYNGAMVDIASMMQKLEKSEKAREEIEQKLMVQDSKMGMSWISLYCICYLWKWYHGLVSCRLHSVSVVHLDNDLAQFELCYKEVLSHFVQHSSSCDLCWSVDWHIANCLIKSIK